uniref:Uncharacterized protein n=1 Tax=Pyrodinium bahamense TaxID=73915 RepID=A0A7S0AC32_9DINO|mmetsp:Transcript_31329/g.86231  ORF Transcript_31329/g.86231 Transcript_31329/m.86231 type:complete len:330 (+) Transcript_31329:162-1151(+)
MAGATGATTGAGAGVGGSTNIRAACLCAASATALVLAMWLAWPRRLKASREEALAALRLLREECASIYVEVAAQAVAAGLSEPHVRSPAAKALAAAAAAAAAAGGAKAKTGTSGAERDAGPSESTEVTASDKLRQAAQQPLVLEGALREAAARAAVALPDGLTAEDLEAELARFAEDPEVRRGTEEVRQMHEACLEGRAPAALCDETGGGTAAQEPWAAEEVLRLLRELASAKARAVRGLVSAARAAGAGGKEAQCLGAQVVHACAKAEDEVWERHWPGNGSRRRRFLPALERFSADDRRFRERRAVAERELEAIAALAATGQRPPNGV